MIDFPFAAASPTSKAAFHCLYWSPNFTIKMSVSFNNTEFLIEFMAAPFLSCQNLFGSLPKIFTPQSSEFEWFVFGELIINYVYCELMK